MAQHFELTRDSIHENVAAYFSPKSRTNGLSHKRTREMISWLVAKEVLLRKKTPKEPGTKEYQVYRGDGQVETREGVIKIMGLRGECEDEEANRCLVMGFCV